MLASYHNHTKLCKHAEGSVEEYVLRAIEKGYSVLGFSDHAPFVIPEHLKESRMSIEQLPLYVNEITSAREKYKGKIDVRRGLELEYLPKYHRAHVRAYREAGIEYLILGQHYTSSGPISDAICSFSETKDKGLYTFYVDQCIEALTTGDFCCFAHPDVFKFTGCRDFYLSESERLIRAAIKYSIPLEINMYGLADKRHYPRDDFWDLASKLGATVILGRDAHKPIRVHNDEEFPRAEAFLKKHGLEKLRIEELKF